MKDILIIIAIVTSYLTIEPVMARECNLPKQWQKLCPVLQSRVEQTIPKMKLQESEAQHFENYLQNIHANFLYLPRLQILMPKTTTELLMATYKRGLDKNEADEMAKYLIEQVEFYKFKNPAAFDSNTSHIIGREWYEIDYSGESMTWQKQKQKYAPYGIANFKSLKCLQKFFPVESRLPYFNKIYQPSNGRL